ncbi:FecR family protein [Formosa sp. 3Alg 14/1]|uniref:FecR family protein n=1 Tax=Formosa sp. 3Alg 14/1 TaxID=3382190 RepID=UPI0039BDEEF1
MNDIEKIIVKYINQEANYSELQILEKFLRNKNGIRIFNQFVKTQYISTLFMVEYDINKAKTSIKSKLKKGERLKRLRLYRGMAIAASVILIFGTAFYYVSSGYQDNINKVGKENHLIISGTDKAILTLENGDEVVLEKGEQFQKDKVRSNGEALIYDKEQNEVVSQQQYNYLTIPRGGQFFVKLSDGTEIWLNSETKLKYPTVFMEGISREVELIYGEAYFKVSPSTEHKGSGFHVISKYQEVNVLGTEFNIRAYNNDDVIATTLVEGAIKIQKENITETLKPNQQAIISPKSEKILVNEIDVSQEISWVNGLFSFNEKPLEEIMEVLSRWYNTEVVFENSKQKKFVFTGILEKTESVDGILRLIEATSENQLEFEINGNIIIIK